MSRIVFFVIGTATGIFFRENAIASPVIFNPKAVE